MQRYARGSKHWTAQTLSRGAVSCVVPRAQGVGAACLQCRLGVPDVFIPMTCGPRFSLAGDPNNFPEFHPILVAPAMGGFPIQTTLRNTFEFNPQRSTRSLPYESETRRGSTLLVSWSASEKFESDITTVACCQRTQQKAGRET